ncbi:site-specific integrase [Georgenia sp. MJ206]|uniref:tyrosine-type recombinase/integrase n=1 Tax=Georgenia wangjunii TaxID=3117730 RepID=UPI002F26CB1C
MKKTRTGKYSGRYRGADGREYTAPGGPFAHKAAALRAAGEAEAASRDIGWRSPEAARMTWGAWCEAWWPTRSVEASTLRADVGRRDLHLIPRWGDVPLGAITRHDIRAWAAELRAGDGSRERSAATVQRIVHLLSASLAAAVDAGILTANPATRMRLGGGQGSAERYLTRDEFAALHEHLAGEHARMAALLVATGMRWGEAAGLHTARIDRERGVVEVAEVWSTTGRAMKPYPKGRQRRHVPLPSWVELDGATSRECGYPHPLGRCRSGLAVTTPAGAILDDSLFRKVFAAAAKAAGVGHVRVHDLRHTYASWLLQDGVPLAEVGRLLGHQSPLTTQRYAHLADVPTAAVLAALRRPGRDADGTQTDAEPRYAGLRVVQSEGR